VQRDFHDRAFDSGRWQIITADGADAGMLDVEYRPAEAREKGRDLVLDVLAVNHRAQALYQRLGLTEVARHGDGNIKITMRLSGQRS